MPGSRRCWWTIATSSSRDSARDQLHTWYLTESDGKRVGVFPIDERLRYLIPFRPPEETAEYLRGLNRAGHAMALLADDGEKFGGWPGHEGMGLREGLVRPLRRR